MEEEKFELLLLSSQSSQLQLAKLISYIFSNEHLYVDAPFRRLIEADRKGFVSALQLLKLTLIQQYFEDIGLRLPSQQLTFLRATVVKYCPHLHYSEDRVRRLDPWSKEIIRGMKPVCLTGILQPLTVSDIRYYFGDDCFTTSTKIVPNTQKPILVYTKSALQKAKALSSSAPFKVMNYYDFCRERARDSRLFEASVERAYRPLQFTSKKIKDVFMERQMETHEDHFHEIMHQRQLKLEELRNKKHRHSERRSISTLIATLGARNNEAEEQMFQLVAKRANPQLNAMLEGVIEGGQLY